MWGVAQPALNFVQNLSWNHMLDIGIMWFLLYQVYIRFKGTQAMRLLVRVFAVWLIYLVSQTAGLHLTSFLLWAIWIAVLILFLINFHGEIQKIFFQLNPVRRFSILLRRAMRIRLPDENVAVIAQSAFSLAAKHMGAIIVVEHRDLTDSLLRSPGEEIEADIQPALLETIFFKGSPYHDGAAVVRENKVSRAGCVLPLSENNALPPEFGTRHRAAVGITERCDALAIVISEERGEITCVEGGLIKAMENEDELASWLTTRLRAAREAGQAKGRISLRHVFENWRPKLAALAAVIFLWSLGGQENQNPQNFFPQLESKVEEEFRVPVHYYNLPGGVALPADAAKEVKIRLRGRRDLLNYIDASRLRVNVNLAKMTPGAHSRTLSGRDIDLPNDLEFLSAEPKILELNLAKAPGPEKMTKSSASTETPESSNF